MNEVKPGYISSEDIRAQWKCSRQTLWRYRDEGLIPVKRHKWNYYRIEDANAVAQKKGLPPINNFHENQPLADPLA